MDAAGKLERKKNAVERELTRILSKGSTSLHQAMRYAVLSGGKRFRPLLTLCSGEAFGAELGSLLPYACALELIHNYSLVHDDLPAMDDDDFRRGHPSCHKAFGEDVAILAGDALLTLAFEVLAEVPSSECGSGPKERCVFEISRSAGVEGLIGGQLMDITADAAGISAEDYEELIRKKTGTLIQTAVKVGAILGGASSRELDAMTAFGDNIGLAFQTQDDIRDAAQDTPGKQGARPNSVSIFGLEKSKTRLRTFVKKGIRALEETGVKSEQLEYLARMLLDAAKGERE